MGTATFLSVASDEQCTTNALTDTRRAWLSRLESFEAPYLAAKMLRDGTFMTRRQFDEAFREFKNFVAVAVLVDDGVGMVSVDVDAVWHQFILFTPQYHEFCDEFVGHYLHHVPSMSDDDGKDDGTRFLHGYEQLFGELPELWRRSTSAGGKPQCSKPRPPSCSKPPPPLPRPKCGPR